MQRVSLLELQGDTAAVLAIARDGPARRRQVHAHLMSVRARSRHLDQRPATMALERAQPRATAPRTFDLFARRQHDAARARRMRRERLLEQRCVRQPEVGHDREIALVQPLARERSAQRLEGERRARRQDQTRGARVEAMQQTRLARAVANPVHLGIAAEQRASERPRRDGPQRGARLPRGLVDHDQIRALEHDRQRRLGLGWRRTTKGAEHLHPLAGSQPARLDGTRTVYPHQPLFGEPARTLPPELRALLDQEFVQTLAMRRWLHRVDVQRRSRSGGHLRLHHCPDTASPSGVSGLPSSSRTLGPRGCAELEPAGPSGSLRVIQ
jgi:hypothetical protein